MCNRRIRVLRESSVEFEDNPTQVVMDSPTTLTNTPGSVLSSNEDNPPVKFLCSFNGNILPRPQDGKLRYVGGETRIVSVPRDIGFEELMARMKELFEGASVLKYQQPDEDLDALVSVVNDDDVTNMMEEYDKLGSGDGFTRLRIFLFSNHEQDDSIHFIDGDERDNERRYVDALNSLNDSPELQGMAPMDDIQLTEHYFNQLNLEGSVHNQRNLETPMTPVNLHHLRIPHLGSLQHQSRYNEMESPWSPAYYSPRHPPNDFPTSPSSSRYHTPYGEPVDRHFDRVPHEDYFRQQHVHHQPQFDQQSQLPENVVWLPQTPLSGDPTGFPGNILQGSGMIEGNNVCGRCRSPFPRNQAPDLPNNGFHQVANPCPECPPGRDTYINTETKFPPPLYSREQNDPRSFYNPGSGRLSDHYIVDGNGMNVAPGPSAYQDGHHVPSHYVHHEERPRYIHHGPEYGNELFHGQTLATGSPHFPYAYGPENLYHPSSHGHVPANAFWRNAQGPTYMPPSYEPSASPLQENGTCSTGFIRTRESSPGLRIGVENQVPWVDGAAVPVHSHGHASKLTPSAYNLESQHHIPPEPVQFTPGMLNCSNPTNHVMGSDPTPILVDDKVLSLNTLNTEAINDANGKESVRKVEEMDGCERGDLNGEVKNANSMASHEAIRSNCLLAEQIVRAENSHENALTSVEKEELEAEQLSYVPQSIESVKKVSLNGAEEIKAEAQEDGASAVVNDVREETANELDSADAPGDLDLDSDSENQNNSKIEPTKAEEEAIARGLQTIKNDDLEEIRELGSGTYGAVYHGKWKGSDVAIKRIKASCFAGRPSERERLIADFWKEALILSSLHHPNVVSFYGIVRDGPDGSLGTVTEFMINGSLKQFLQKKDRTIDRRKRLIIAMDAAFGMEYLHGKNIVHFDLKCENLLVNMRDPHRPICKIGDLGLSKVKQHTLVSGGVRGTLPWMAPELLSGKSHMVTEKIDVYSFGIVMWELLTGDEPYADRHCASIIGGIVNDSLRPTVPTWCDPEWKALMESCWSGDPTQRPSFSQISQKLRTMAAAINVK